MARLRSVVAAVVLVVLASVLAPTALADSPIGPVVINDGAQFTNNPLVSITLPSPADDSGLYRLSSDGVAWGATMPWQQTVQLDVSDPTTGGSAEDGLKTVYVAYDDGRGTWSSSGTGTITLDRTPPEEYVDPTCIPTIEGWIDAWNTTTYSPPSCANNWSSDNYGIARTEVSLDGKSWMDSDAVWRGGLDFRALYLGGSWQSGNRQVCDRLWDLAGNFTVYCRTYNLVIPDQVQVGNGSLYDVRFEFPRPAVTGQPFTIRPVFPPDWPAMPTTALCEWVLTWGDDGKMHDFPNEDFRQAWTTHLFRNGGCNEWTFTLPYTPGLTYNFTFSVAKDWGHSVVYAASTDGRADPDVTTFHATVGTNEPGIPQSTMGVAYLLPRAAETRPGEPVTYDLKFSGPAGWTPPAKAWFWASSSECGSLFGSDAPTADRTYTYTPDCQGPWTTGWTWEDHGPGTGMTGEYLRAEFDPPADKAPPLVTAPQVVLAPGVKAIATIPATVSWTSKDPVARTVSTGVVRNQLQVSRNRGKWKNVALPSAKSTSVLFALQPKGSYRFRVRAFDAVGNKSAWAVGPVLKPVLNQQSAATLSSGWSTISRTGLSGGSAVFATASGASAQLSFTGRAISWIGSAGQGAGLAQVFVDGALVQTVDLGAPSASDQMALFTRSWAGSASHTIRIVVLGTYGRPAVTVDAFAIVR